VSQILYSVDWFYMCALFLEVILRMFVDSLYHSVSGLMFLLVDRKVIKSVKSPVLKSSLVGLSLTWIDNNSLYYACSKCNFRK